jgi:hypothetical protein
MLEIYQPHDAMIGYVVFVPDHLPADCRVKGGSTSGIEKNAECKAHRVSLESKAVAT